MTATCVVLNGTSCSGKSSIAAVLQELWPRPLQVTGIDTFLAAQSARFFASDGRVVAGFSWIPVTVDGQPAFDVVPGLLGLGMIKASHAYRAASAAAGLDQVIDDVWLVPDQPAGLQDALVAANTLWVGCIARWPSPSSGNENAATVPSARCAVSTLGCTRSGSTTWTSTPRQPPPVNAPQRSLPRLLSGLLTFKSGGVSSVRFWERDGSGEPRTGALI
jgi:hypothetical protein